LGALVFVVLLVIFLAKGYDCASSAYVRAQEERRRPRRPLSRPVAETKPAPAEEDALGVFAELLPDTVEATDDVDSVDEEELSEAPVEDLPIYADLGSFTPEEEEVAEDEMVAGEEKTVINYENEVVMQ
jgi:hypothetical protein